MQFKRSAPPCSATPERGTHGLAGVSCVQVPGALRVRAALEARRGPSANGGERTQKKLIRLPAEQSSVIGSFIVRLWFALRAAVLRLAVSQLYFLVRHQPITVAARLARSQNAWMLIAPNDVPSQGLVAIAAAADECTSITLRAVRANPAFKRTAYGRRLTLR